MYEYFIIRTEEKHIDELINAINKEFPTLVTPQAKIYISLVVGRNNGLANLALYSELDDTHILANSIQFFAKGYMTKLISGISSIW